MAWQRIESFVKKQFIPLLDLSLISIHHLLTNFAFFTSNRALQSATMWFTEENHCRRYVCVVYSICDGVC